MAPENLDYTLTFRLTDGGMKKINELNKEELEEAKKIIDKALKNYEDPEEVALEEMIKKLERDFEVSRDVWNNIGKAKKIKKVIEKLQALKKLKDKGFKFDGWTIDDGLRVSICTNFDGGNIYSESEKEIRISLDSLFGGEE